MILKINSLADVENFLKQLVSEGVNVHPDDDFTQYVNNETGIDTFTSEEATLRNQLMGKCFDVCEEEGVDIYSFTNDIFLKETGLDKFIPLSTQENFEE